MDFRKSTYSNGGQACVEVASGLGAVQVRDTANRDGGTLVVGASAWSAFLTSVK